MIALPAALPPDPGALVAALLLLGATATALLIVSALSPQENP